MKKLKINYCDYPLGYDFRNDLIFKILQKRFEVDICDNPDYVFYSCFGFEHLNIPDDCVTIFVTGEDEFPNFNLCDYALGFEYLDMDDRYMRFPLYYFFVDENEMMEKKHILPKDFSLKNKPDFCSFVVSNEKATYLRGQMYELLSKYKTVDSGGKYKNNTGGPIKNKLDFDKKHKFSICFENASHRGYTTEKIMQAFAARAIPIYWGDPLITRVFNSKSFINVMDYDSLEDVVREIKKIDNDDKQYFEMLQQPALLNDEDYGSYVRRKLEDFLFNIVEQPKLMAYRKSRLFHQKRYKETRLYFYKKCQKIVWYCINLVEQS